LYGKKSLSQIAANQNHDRAVGVQAPYAKPAGEQNAEHAQAIIDLLDQHKAEDILLMPLAGKTTIADFMLIASAQSSRHAVALSHYVEKYAKDHDLGSFHCEGRQNGDWVLCDLGTILVHLFRPEIREFYALEKMWDFPNPGT